MLPAVRQLLPPLSRIGTIGTYKQQMWVIHLRINALPAHDIAQRHNHPRTPPDAAHSMFSCKFVQTLHVQTLQACS